MLVTLTLSCALAAPADADRLVGRLRAAAFADRRRAEAALLELAGDAVPALRRGLGDPDPDVRQRCERLLPACAARDRSSRLARLVAGEDDVSLPGWPAFRAACGGDAAGRRLYAAAYAANAALLDAWAAGDPSAPARFDAACDRVSAALRAGPPTDAARADAAAVLLVAPALVGDYAATGRRACEAVQPMRWRADGPANAPVRRLFAAWLASAPDRRVQAQLLSIASDGYMAECLPAALKVAGDVSANPNVRALALLVVARLGDRGHVSGLRPVLSDRSPVYEGVEFAGAAYDVELGDVALAVSVHLAGADPRAFGFEAFAPGSAERPAWRTYAALGFRDAAARAAARERWEAWPARPR